MQGGILWIRTIKCVALYRRHILGIAIDIKEFGAIRESIIPYVRHTIGDSNRGQTRATRESKRPYELHTIADSNRGQTRATRESTLIYARDKIVLFYNFVIYYLLCYSCTETYSGIFSK